MSSLCLLNEEVTIDVEGLIELPNAYPFNEEVVNESFESDDFLAMEFKLRKFSKSFSLKLKQTDLGSLNQTVSNLEK